MYSNPRVTVLDAGWLFRVSLDKPEQATALMDEKAYEKYVEGLSDD